jgi:hypothetical protein
MCSQAPWWIQMWISSENNERAKGRGMFPDSQHFGVKGHAGALGWD